MRRGKIHALCKLFIGMGTTLNDFIQLISNKDTSN